MTEKIDIHKPQQALRVALSHGKAVLGSTNHELIKRFTDDCALGTTGKKVREHRLCRYVADLNRITEYFSQKPLDKINAEELKAFYSDLQNNKIRKKNKEPYGGHSKEEFVKTLKKFYGWLYSKPKEREKFQELVGWFQRDFGKKEDPPAALTKQDIERLAADSKVFYKTLAWFLFDSGARAEECLNVRIKHIIKEEPYCKVRIEHSKTMARTIVIPMATPFILEWLKQHPEQNNPDAQLFRVTYPAMLKQLKILGQRVLKRNITPHLFRHSSVTYWANQFRNPYKINYRFGWSTSSDMAQTYIDREGLMEEETAQVYEANELSQVQKELNDMKQTLAFRKQADEVVSALLEDPRIKKILLSKSSDKDFVEKIKAVL